MSVSSNDSNYHIFIKLIQVKLYVAYWKCISLSSVILEIVEKLIEFERWAKIKPIWNNLLPINIKIILRNVKTYVATDINENDQIDNYYSDRGFPIDAFKDTAYNVIIVIIKETMLLIIK